MKGKKPVSHVHLFDSSLKIKLSCTKKVARSQSGRVLTLKTIKDPFSQTVITMSYAVLLQLFKQFLFTISELTC